MFKNNPGVLRGFMEELKNIAKHASDIEIAKILPMQTATMAQVVVASEELYERHNLDSDLPIH